MEPQQKLIDRFYGILRPPSRGEVREITWAKNLWTPKIDYYGGGDAFKIRVILPGVQKGDIDLEFVDGKIIIKGERKYEIEEEEVDKWHYESYYGQFQRIIAIPETVKVNEKAHAVFENGILTITMEKMQLVQPMKIPIV